MWATNFNGFLNNYNSYLLTQGDTIFYEFVFMLGSPLVENGLIELNVNNNFVLSAFSSYQNCYSYLGLEDISDEKKVSCQISGNKLVINQFKKLEIGAIIGVVFKATNPIAGTYSAIEVATYQDAAKTKRVDATLTPYGITITNLNKLPYLAISYGSTIDERAGKTNS